MTDLTGKSAIVTGGAQGIGAHYARGLAAAGATVSICDTLDPAGVVDEINRAGGRAIGRVADITDSEAMTAMARETVEQLGGIDILVNNAAIFSSLRRGSFFDIDSDTWDRVLAVNVRGTFEVIKAVTRHMRDRKYGKIVNISSTTVSAGAPLLLHYVTSKGAIIAMTRALARELGPDGIRVNCMAPGLTLSEGVTENEQYSSQVRGNIAAGRAIARDQLPQDLVGTLLYLCSEASDFVSGQTINVDGGAQMR
jgi:NAD(P)-dependent dehydrogenase (short-subunit alcohol dehydrogenase family)